MVILQDVREKNPIPFKDAGVTVEVVHLDTGDYSIRGLENIFRAERKTPKELFQCCGSDRERFRRQLQRLGAFPVRALIIEGSLTDAWKKPPGTGVTERNVIFRISTWSVEFGVPLWFLGRRSPQMVNAVVDAFEAVYRFYRSKPGWISSWNRLMSNGGR